MSRRTLITAATAFLFVGIAAGALFLSGALTSRAVQNPVISLDMITTGNAYIGSTDDDFNSLPDPGTNVMNVGAINNCLPTAAPGTAVTHAHTVQLITQPVENLVGEIWTSTWVSGVLTLSKVVPRPTVKSILAHPGDVVRNVVIAQTIAFVD